MPEDKTDPFKRFVRFITFVDIPIRKKFFLFFIGVLFWFLGMATVALLSLGNINQKSDRIVHYAIPQCRVVQKITRNLQALTIDTNDILSANSIDVVVGRADVSNKRLDDIRTFVSGLSLGGDFNDYSRDTGKLLEHVHISDPLDDSEGVVYLKKLSQLSEDIGSAFGAFYGYKLESLNGKLSSAQKLEESSQTLQALIDEANDLSTDFSTRISELYQDHSQTIKKTIRYAIIGVLSVLLVAVVLLGVFTRWISEALSKPLRSIINQIHSVATGEVDLSRKITINSKDEIGALSSEFNDLMETVHKRNMYKKVIEEDVSLEDIYSRLGDVFRGEIGIEDFIIYEVSDNQESMKPVYPVITSDGELKCDKEILGDSELCRAKKTGHTISSLSYPRVCKQFCEETQKWHVCVPMNVGGRTGGVVQFLFDPTEDRHLDSKEIQKKIQKAEIYIKESLSVIEAKRLMNTLRASALIDPLTGLYNRRFLQDHASHIIAGVLRREKNLGLLMCDLDYFKQVNDQYGHDVGDTVLKETSEIIKKSVREADVLIRFGGEEFLILLMDVEEGESVLVAEKIRENMEKAKIGIPNGTISKTISLGVAEFPRDTEAFWQAIKYADVAMYQAKEKGRNRVLRFEPEMWSGSEF